MWLVHFVHGEHMFKVALLILCMTSYGAFTHCHLLFPLAIIIVQMR